MRIMYDTNVLISMIFFPSERLNRLHEIVTLENTLVLSSYVIEELKEVTQIKFHVNEVIDKFLDSTFYESVQTPQEIQPGLFEIRDMNDYPVLYSAIVGNVDIFITGDKDLKSVNISKPSILTPSEFLALYTS